MVSESNDLVEEVVVITKVEDYRKGQTIQIETRLFSAPVSFDDVSPTNFKRIAFMPWLDRSAMRADAET